MSSIHKAMQRYKQSRDERSPLVTVKGSTSGPENDDAPAVVSPTAELDLRRLHRAGLLTPHSGHKHLVEEYRRIKRPLVENATSELEHVKRGNLIMVTSSLPDEGKTFTAFNLAVSITMELEKTVLLVDGDLQRGELSNMLGFDGKAGLAEKLSGNVSDLSEVMFRTNVPHLSFLPAGKRASQAPELLASNGMRVLSQELSERYSDRIIVFDSPPLLVTSESSVLAGLMGQIVMVIEAESTSESAVSDGLAYLAGCEIVGLVLNKTPRRFGSQYYGGYYGPYQQ